MAGFTDAMAIDGKALIRKIRNGKSLRKGGAVNLEQCDIKITSTVQGGIITLEIPEKNLLITCRLQDVLAVISAANKMDCQHFFRQIFLGYFPDIVQASDTLRKNVCGDDYTSLHNPIVLSSVLPAYGMFHSIQILFL